MKKSLSLLLALAMVLSMVPAVFAEEAETLPSYDLSYAFNLADGKTFAGGADGLISDYDGGLTPALSQDITKGNLAAEKKADLFALGYWWNDIYYGNTILNRPSVNHFAPADTNNANKETGMISLAYTYNKNIDSASGDYVADEVDYGTMAYNFGAGRIDELAMTADTGIATGYLGKGSLPVIRFKAPRSGYVNPVIKLSTLDADGLFFIVRKLHFIDPTGKLNNKGWATSGLTETENAIWTTVYPTADETTYARPASTNVSAVIAPDEGWAKAPANVMTTRDDAVVYVNAGDEITITFGKKSNANTQFAIDTIRMDYVDEFTLSADADYKAGNPVLDVADILAKNNIVTEGMTYTVAEASADLLTATNAAGIFTIANTAKDKDVVTVIASDDKLSATLNVTLNVPKAVYDFAEAFEVTNTFSGVPRTDYASPLTLKTALGAGAWNVGYAYYSANTSTSATFYKNVSLLRSNMYTYAPNDVNNPYKTTNPTEAGPALTFGYSSNSTKTVEDGGLAAKITQTAGVAVYGDEINGGYGTAGYGFSSGKLIPNSSLSVQGVRSMTVIAFTAPRTGIIKPYLKLANPNADAGVYYRMYKLGATQNLGANPTDSILPKAGESANSINLAANTNLKGLLGTVWDGDTWCVVPRSNDFTTRNDTTFYVEAGEQVVVRFYTTAAYGANFVIDTLKYDYVDQMSFDTEFFYSKDAVDMNAWMEEQGVDTSSAVWSEVEDEFDVAQLTADGQLVMKALSPEGSSVRVKALVGDISYFVDVTIVSYAATVSPFSYPSVDMTELGHEDPVFLLPYYSDPADRAVYGEIDLGLNDAWYNAEASFDVKGKFEYFNGRIRAIALHDYLTAGGDHTKATGDELVLANATRKPVRDVNTTGEPVVMTLTATDGTQKHFNLWSFETKLRGEEAASDTYQYMAGSENNAIFRIEAVKLGAEDFVPMYRDSAYGLYYSMTPYVGDRYTFGGVSYPSSPVIPTLDKNGQITLPTYYWPDGRQWKTHFSNKDFADLRGVSFTFTAPYSGEIKLTDFAPKNEYSLSASMGGFNSYLNQTGGCAATAMVRAYNADGTYTTLYEEKWGNTANKSPYSLMGNATVAASATLANAGDDQTLTFTVQKGQDIRVILMISEKLYTNSNMPLELGNYSPAPIFDYTKVADEFDGTHSIYALPSTFENLTGDGVLTMVYDANGNLLDAIVGIEEINEADEYVKVALREEGYDETPAYAKMFFWNGLENIVPLAEALYIRN